MLTSSAELDEAIESQKGSKKDPTGGRGLHGSIGSALEQSRDKEKELLRSAV